MSIKENLEKLISISAVVVKSLNDAEKEVKDAGKKKEAIENEIKLLRENNLEEVKRLQSDKNGFKEYERTTKTDLENQKSKLEALVKEVEGKLKTAEENFIESEKKLANASVIQKEAEKLKLLYEERVKKFKEALAQ